jgi:hypothetical protein
MKGECTMADIEKLEPMNAATDAGSSRRQGRQQRRAEREQDGGGWLAGVVLLVIGVLYLFHNYGLLPSFTNWWALFLLLPGLGTLSAALSAYQRHGQPGTTEVIVPLLASLFFMGLTASFLFELQIGWLWPLFLIAGGLLLLAGPALSRR